MNKKDNKNIIETDLSTLLKRFAGNDVVNKISDEYQSSNSLRMDPNLIRDNKYLKQIGIDSNKIKNIMNEIGEKGVIDSLLIRPINDGKYEVVSGRKRLLAAQKLSIASIPVIIHQFSDEEMLLFLLMVMAEQRDTNAIELATICKALCENHKYTQTALAQIMKISRPQITNLMRLLNLPNAVLNDVIKGKISYGHAKAVATLDSLEIESVIKQIIECKLSVRQTEKVVRNLKNADEFIVAEKMMEEATGARVKINSHSINLTFENKEALKDFLDKKLK